MGLTRKTLADRLGVSLWELERLERGEADPTPHLAALEEHLGLPSTAPAEARQPAVQPGPTAEAPRGGAARLFRRRRRTADRVRRVLRSRLERGEADPTPHLAAVEEHVDLTSTAPAEARQPAVERGPTADAPERPSDLALEKPAPWEAWLVLGSIAALVLVRLFTEVIAILPKAANVIDIPILIALTAAAFLTPRARPRVSPGWLAPLAAVFLLLCTVASITNPSRVEIGPGLLFVYGILSPLLLYGAAYRLWPAGQARLASRLVIALGIVQLVIVFAYQLPTFFFDNDVTVAGVDRIAGSFGTNPYQLVFFLLVFVAVVAGVYTFEPRRPAAKLAPIVIPAALAAIIFAQYRALLITMGLTLLLIGFLLGSEKRGFRGAHRRGWAAAFWAMIAFVVVVGVGATQFPVLRIDRVLELDPKDLVSQRMQIVDQLDDLYSDEPRFIVTGTGPGTFSSRGWYTFARATSESRSNATGKYVLELTGGRLYSTDVSDRYVTDRGRNTEIVAGSRAINSPFSSYISIAAEVGLLGLVVVLTMYGGMFLSGIRRARDATRAAVDGDPLPSLMIAAPVGLFVLLQMALLNNWLEVTRLTFLTWGLLAIANREFDARQGAVSPPVAERLKRGGGR
jgi:hypothetical protein